MLAFASLIVALLSHLVMVATSTRLMGRRMFTTNAICQRNRCINPIFPGLTDMKRLQSSEWQGTTLQEVGPVLNFCRDVVTYDPAIPGFSLASGPRETAKKQEQAAITMFVYHLNALGIETWDNQDPSRSDDECIKSVWRMVCFTYLPRSTVKPGQAVAYTRPCQNSCQNYIKSCAVECCDESVECVFSHKKKVAGTGFWINSTGYAPEDGPSPHCTGAASRSGRLSLPVIGLALAAFFARFAPSDLSLPRVGGARVSRLALCVVLGAIASSLQGCGLISTEVQVHWVGNWRGEPDYLVQYQYIPQGSLSKTGFLNSCNFIHALQCSGRGACVAWNANTYLENPIALCKCDAYWADPECRTRRLSQWEAFFYSLFLGYLGVDQFYLGYSGKGFMKLLVFAAFLVYHYNYLFCLHGLWRFLRLPDKPNNQSGMMPLGIAFLCVGLWVHDLTLLGLEPVYSAGGFRIAADLPQWIAAWSSVVFFATLGFTFSFGSILEMRKQKYEAAVRLMHDENYQATATA